MRLALPGALAFAICSLAAEREVILSRHAKSDFALTLDSGAEPWGTVPPVLLLNDPDGNPVPGHRTEIRSRWTAKYLYFLYVSPYETLNLHPDPSSQADTVPLWEWDVVELFISSETDFLRHYRELQVSPQGEWVDLDINRDITDRQPWKWNSGFEVNARIDRAAKIWYGAMRIPWSSIDKRPAAEGNELHLSICRIQGIKPDRDRKRLVWGGSFHRPEGIIRLVR